jgi:serine/threonine protein kinase
MGRDPQTGLLYLAFERLHGQTLEEKLAGGKAIPWREALVLSERLASALQHAHTQGVIHRDIKPANIMVLSSGEPKIMDFGIAKAPASQLTRAGEIFGTPSFMSPEQARGRPLDHRSDLFSLGAVLYQMLTGTKAFEGASALATLTIVIDKDPPPPSSVAQGLPPEADYLVARALAKDRADRYPDGRTLAEDLEDVLEGREPRHRPGWSAKSPPRPAAPTPQLPEATPTPTLALDLVDVAPATKRNDVAPAAETRVTRRSPRRPTTVVPLLALLAVVGLAFTAGAWWLLRGDPPAPRPVREAAASASPSAPVAGRLEPPSALPSVTPSAPAVPIPRTQPASAPPATRPSPRAVAPRSQPRPTKSVPATPMPSPMPAASVPAVARPAPTPSRLAVDFEHGLKAATLQVWVDGDLVLQRELTSEVTQKVVVVLKRKGAFNQTVEVRPGHHAVRVRVSWDDDEERTGTISGPFEAGAARALAIRLNGRRKTLSLEWR